jgi:hypothetical protein
MKSVMNTFSFLTKKKQREEEVVYVQEDRQMELAEICTNLN